MGAVKQKLYNLVEDLSDSELAEIVNFTEYVRARDQIQKLKNLELYGISDLSFWDNEIDDEVWNNA
jgi:hypothetical protein